MRGVRGGAGLGDGVGVSWRWSDGGWSRLSSSVSWPPSSGSCAPRSGRSGCLVRQVPWREARGGAAVPHPQEGRPCFVPLPECQDGGWGRWPREPRGACWLRSGDRTSCALRSFRQRRRSLLDQMPPSGPCWGLPGLQPQPCGVSAGPWLSESPPCPPPCGQREGW